MIGTHGVICPDLAVHPLWCHLGPTPTESLASVWLATITNRDLAQPDSVTSNSTLGLNVASSQHPGTQNITKRP
ncbi:hypothetical protein NL676_007296 [Syzygium grande]|nr:hypothetical protein NL676_007296 [Syzygium grande]